jgi:hypothetical protein
VLIIASLLAAAACGKRPALAPRDGAVSPDTNGAVGGGNDAGVPIEAGATTDGDTDAGASVTIDGATTGGRDGRDGALDGDGADGGMGPGPGCTPEIGARVPPAPLRRLSSFAYANTVRDVLAFRCPRTRCRPRSIRGMTAPPRSRR